MTEPIARTSHIDLLEPSMHHVKPLHALWSDPETMRYIGGGTPWTEADVRTRIERQIGFRGDGGPCFWTLRERATGDIVGQGGVVPISFNGPEHELGYRLGRAHWGRGYATEVAEAARDLAFGRFGLDRLVAVCYAENAPSRRVLQKVGFRELGETDAYYGVTCLLHELTRDTLHRP